MPESTTRKKSPAIPLLVALVAAFVLIVTVTGARSGDDDAAPARVAQDSSPSAGTAPADDPFARRTADDPLAKGDVDAPVVMVAYSDFQCPFCGKFARDTFPALEEKYVEDGTLRVEWRDFPYLGAESTTAALAGRAAAAQDGFWEFHDALYAEELPPNSGKLDQEYVEGLAEKVGLDVKQFRADMTDPSTQEQVTADFQEGQSIGVTGTPSFLINGVPVVGAQPIEVFEQVIEEAAAQ